MLCFTSVKGDPIGLPGWFSAPLPTDHWLPVDQAWLTAIMYAPTNTCGGTVVEDAGLLEEQTIFYELAALVCWLENWGGEISVNKEDGERLLSKLSCSFAFSSFRNYRRNLTNA